MRNKEIVLTTIGKIKSISQTSMASMDKKAITPKALYDNLRIIHELLEQIEIQINRE